MTTLSTDERVTQAVVERLELLNKLRVKEIASGKAAGERSQVRSDPAVDAAVADKTEKLRVFELKSNETWESAKVKLNVAMDKFIEKQASALADAVSKQESDFRSVTDEHTERISTARNTHSKEVEGITKQQVERDRAVTARAHVAEKAVLDMRVEVEEQRARTQKALGIDLAAFVNLPEAE